MRSQRVWKLTAVIVAFVLGPDCLSQTLGGIYFGIRGPVEFILTDAAGHRSGYDPRSGVYFDEITYGTYGAEGVGDENPVLTGGVTSFQFSQEIVDPSFVQNYTVLVVGTGPGVFS